MGTNGEAGLEGPTLYEEADELDPSETFCTTVFDDSPEEEYRVVQLTSTQSFDSLRDALDTKLDQIDDPSEAAVIITTPRSGDETAVSEVGAGTPLYGFRVNPQDLTGISVAFSKLVERWEQSEGSVKICLRDIESLLPYHDPDLIYRFLNTVLATLQGAGADVHAHLRPSAIDERTYQLFASLFARVVESDQPAPEPTDGVETDRDSDARSASDATSHTPEDAAQPSEIGDEHSALMPAEAVDAFLRSEGYGVLAFDGASPYAIPMSYGYDTDERVFYLQLSSFEGSEKQTRLDSSDRVSLVVSEYERPDQWRSVVIEGRVSKLSAQAVRDRDVIDVFANSKMTSVDVFTRDLSDISFDWYLLEPSEISGRWSGE